jgi:ectoine hydroxylase-related dioxygenase (phytanoyl-CoA dioxygenase family)
LHLLEKRRKKEQLTDADFEALRHWAETGYIVMRDVVAAADVDGMLVDLDNVWTATSPIENLIIDDLRLKPEDPPGVPHARLISLDQSTRDRLKNACHWRIHGFWQHSASALRIFKNPELIRMTSLILGRQTEPCYTINFTFGSGQNLHQDSAVFCVWPMNYLVGAWLACEDVNPDSGPLVYYAGSHREKLFPRFDNYPQTMLRTCPLPMMDEYYRYLEQVAQRYERRAFVPKKGEVFFWHGMMIHGGDTIKNPLLTRRSYVCHYIPPGLNKESEISGPFNW